MTRPRSCSSGTPRGEAVPSSRSACCGGTSIPTSSAAPSSFPAGRSTTTTGRPEPRPPAWAGPTPTPRPCSGSTAAGLAFWVAALRECFEEAGVLLAYPEGSAPGSPLVDVTDPSVRGRLGRPADRGERRDGRLPRGLPLRGALPGRRPGPLLQPLDHPRTGPQALRHPLLRHRPPPRSGPHPRRPRDDGHRLGRAGRGPGTGPGRGVRHHLPHHQEPGGHRPFRQLGRAPGGGGRRRAGPHRPAPGGGRRAGLPDPAAR